MVIAIHQISPVAHLPLGLGVVGKFNVAALINTFYSRPAYRHSKDGHDDLKQVQVPNVYFDEQMLLSMHAKDGKQRYVPLLPELTHELQTYLQDRMIGLLCTTTRHTPYSPHRIQQLVQETAALVGITKRVHPHLLRHSVATTLLERGVPLEQSQQFLGHAKLETTQIYAVATTAMIKESYQKALGR